MRSVEFLAFGVQSWGLLLLTLLLLMLLDFAFGSDLLMGLRGVWSFRE